RLETFRLPDPRSVGPGAITRLGELELGSGERLQATRFDGDLAYVVTFFQIDPLWVIDLSDPANPAMVGSVEVPGWSTYIAPMGDRLVTVGVESNRVAVSLFDVHSPAQPSLLDRVLLGPGYSWSEAISDEKAFTVLPDLGLVLVPYDGATTNGWTSRVQLLDLTRTNLVARGIIQHQCQARRTAFAQNRVLSISGWELLSVDIADRDNPLVKGDSQLAWPVDRVFAQGDYLIELSSSSGWWGFQAPPGIRITPAHQPDTILNTLPLTNLPVVGAALKNDKLYIAQSPNGYYMVQPAGGPGGGALTNGPDFYLTVIDAAHLPDLTVLGQASTFAGVGGWGAQWSPAWTSDNILVWIGGGFNWWIRAYPLGPGGVAIGVIWPWWGTSGGQLLAFDVGNPAQPMFDSNVDLRTNGWTGFSAPAVSGPRVYLSHSEYFLATNSIYTNGVWSETHYLDVVDYTDPLNPTLRPPVNIPGDLQGISNQGELLYTTGYHWDPNTAIDWTQWLDASAYDGVSAHLVDSLALSNYWALPVIADTNVFISNGDYYWLATNPAPASIEAWSLSGTGRFTLNGSVMLNQLATKLFEYHGLLASREIDGSLEVFKDTDPNALVRVGYDSPSSCVWYDLSLGDSRPGDALWLPLGAFGVKQVNLGP
ncbi:MAG TPA: beta-propeller domain-containing protein, partial [Verrucomicrobiae bacterium]|nr:beta-propeller domain-containing protein [Verrucomicrobiae bacterium]